MRACLRTCVFDVRCSYVRACVRACWRTFIYLSFAQGMTIDFSLQDIKPTWRRASNPTPVAISSGSLFLLFRFISLYDVVVCLILYNLIYFILNRCKVAVKPLLSVSLLFKPDFKKYDKISAILRCKPAIL